MSLLVSLGVLVFSGERSPKFFNMSKKGHSFSKSLRGMTLLNSPGTAYQGGRFLAWKASSEGSASVEAVHPLRAGGKPCKGKCWVFEVDMCWGTRDEGKPF